MEGKPNFVNILLQLLSQSVKTKPLEIRAQSSVYCFFYHYLPVMDALPKSVICCICELFSQVP